MHRMQKQSIQSLLLFMIFNRYITCLYSSYAFDCIYEDINLHKNPQFYDDIILNTLMSQQSLTNHLESRVIRINRCNKIAV